MRDYHARQMTGSTCQSRNCAAASAAMGAFFGTRGKEELTADDARRISGISCVPGRDTPSGGLTIAAVEDVLASVGVDIDYGRSVRGYRRWTDTQGRTRLGTTQGGVLLGDYGEVPEPWRARGSTFRGGHSVWIHDYRDDLPDSHYDVVQETACWHDPLRARPIRVPWSVVNRYWQKPNGELRGFAGWVDIPALTAYASPMPDRTRTDHPTVAVHDKRTTGVDSATRIIRGDGKLVALYMYAQGEEYRGSTEWGALSLKGDEWVHVKRLRQVRGAT